MGSDANERSLANRLSSPETVAAEWLSAETPRYRVKSEAFCIDRYLVTQERYLDFVTRTRHSAPGISRADYRREGFLVHDYAEWTPYLWKGRTPPRDRLDDPVVLVSALMLRRTAAGGIQPGGFRARSNGRRQRAGRMAASSPGGIPGIPSA